MTRERKETSDSARFYIKKKTPPIQIGEILVTGGHVTREQLEKALEIQRNTKKRKSVEELLAIELFKRGKRFPAVLPEEVLIRNILYEQGFMKKTEVDGLVNELAESHTDRTNLIDLVIERALLSDEKIIDVYKIQGKLFIKKGIVDLDLLKKALSGWKKSVKLIPLGKILIDEGYISERKYIAALAKYTKLPFMDLKNMKLDKSLAGIIPPELVLCYRILPIQDEGRFVTVAVVFPLDYDGLERVIDKIGKYVNRVLCKDSDFESAFKKIYGKRMKWY